MLWVRRGELIRRYGMFWVGDELVVRKSQAEAFLRLALRCVRYKKEDPVSGMIEVGKDLKIHGALASELFENGLMEPQISCVESIR
ncbi:hypothetical protein Bca52824_007580 [Brassica carinata]|uniref:Uncharacterized protein n=1 Tax=Brassica carinata TaxID=52824 RepID=A0A8X8B8C7_BRACI|nr:hypothetical protein Bca52824_007580 [Brassica carinata]